MMTDFLNEVGTTEVASKYTMYVCRARVPTVQFVCKHGTDNALK